MIKDSMSVLVILGLTMAIILSLAAAAENNINIIENNFTVNNTMFNNTSLSNLKANNISLDASSNNNETNGYPISSSLTNVSSNLYTSQMGNGTEIGQTVNKAGHARYTINLGSLAKEATNKPGKDLEKVVFICNIM